MKYSKRVSHECGQDAHQKDQENSNDCDQETSVPVEAQQEQAVPDHESIGQVHATDRVNRGVNEQEMLACINRFN